MAAKFYICMLLVVLVSSAVHSARLRLPQDKEKTSNFLFDRRTTSQGSIPRCCYDGCENCPDDRSACNNAYTCYHVLGHFCQDGYTCCC